MRLSKHSLIKYVTKNCMQENGGKEKTKMKRLNTVLTVVAENGNVKFPIIEKVSFLETDIFALDLDTRSSNALKRNNINTIREILDNLDTIPKFRGCGTKSVNRILYGICSAYYKQLNSEEKTKYLMKIIKLNTKQNSKSTPVG